MKERILEANVEAMRVARRMQREARLNHGADLPLEFYLEHILHLTADVLIIAAANKPKN
ncbi:hypothetical protein QYG89_15900 [Bacillus sp. B190/17]|uniref:Uncharacterized protein n=1 Tax=Bacillus lumedeiriae TaxID=3058829 RepID=A0ABW8IEL1_9BACI